MKLIFIHGSGGYEGIWRYQIAHFLDSEAITLPGHPQGQPCRSVEEYRDWLRKYIKERNYEDIVLAGHSLGGAIAMAYALEYPQDLRGLILIGTGARLKVHPMYIKQLEKAMEGNLEDWYEWMEGTHPLVEQGFKRELIERHKFIGPAVQLNDLLCCHDFDVMDRVQEIKLPALIICGDSDMMTPVKYASYLGDKIQGSKVAIIPGATHLTFIEKPDEVNKAIEEFLRRRIMLC